MLQSSRPDVRIKDKVGSQVPSGTAEHRLAILHSGIKDKTARFQQQNHPPGLHLALVVPEGLLGRARFLEGLQAS